MTRDEMVRMLARLEDAIQWRNKLERMSNESPLTEVEMARYHEEVEKVETIEQVLLDLAD